MGSGEAVVPGNGRMWLWEELDTVVTPWPRNDSRPGSQLVRGGRGTLPQDGHELWTGSVAAAQRNRAGEFTIIKGFVIGT